jgi:hypothetical protein
MRLLRPPRRPDPTVLRLEIRLNQAPESWRDFLYWNLELEDP